MVTDLSLFLELLLLIIVSGVLGSVVGFCIGIRYEMQRRDEYEPPWPGMLE